MADILHKITMAAPKNKVFAALSSVEGLSGWWTTTTEGESVPGRLLTFRFGKHTTLMQVEMLEHDQRVVWECKEQNSEWTGTRLSFELSEDAGRTTLVFRHAAWEKQTPLFAHCSMKWATFLLSLRQYVETGEGRPFPRDIAA